MGSAYTYVSPQRSRDAANTNRRERKPDSAGSTHPVRTLMSGASPNATERATPRLHSLAYLVGEATSAQVAAIQRKPAKGKDDRWTDDTYKDVELENLSFCLYKIVKTGKVVYYDLDERDYFEVDKENYPDYNRPFKIASVSSSLPAIVAPPTKYESIGEKGKGVGNVSALTTLETSGLISCVGWLLYNGTAAYLTHIVVLEPKSVLANGGISRQVNALSALFQTQTGSKPTNVHIKVDGEQPAYGKGGVWKSGWMEELVPASCTASWERGGGDLSYTIQPSSGSRLEWDGPGIKVYTGEKDKRGDIWTSPTTVIPSGGMFEMEL